ncbi:MAG: hypothetical protein KTR25_01565 [Myxococcales bacterium]|nr:hypothetical protein [Myxococcales bacterium]
MKGPDHEKSLLGHVPPGTFASSSERFTKSLARQLHTWPNQPATSRPALPIYPASEYSSLQSYRLVTAAQVRHSRP